MALTILKPGAQTSIQDSGRLGYLNTGLSPAGPLDHLSLRIASLLVGNELPSPLLAAGPRGDAGLEITFMGPQLKFVDDTIFAVTGGTFALKLDGADVPMYEAIQARAGQVLDFGMIKDGARGYLAVAGGIDVAPVLGSRAENLFASRGPLGRALNAGDVLPVGAVEGRRSGARFDRAKLPERSAEPVIRVVMGPQDDLFTEESLHAFQIEPWTLGTQANRMGLRFNGPIMRFRERPDYLARDAGPDPSNIVDDMIPVGGIQCPSGIEAIVMGTENPTVGGFAKIATVISSDIAVVGQMRPGQKARFRAVSSREALAIAHEIAAIASPENLV